MTDTTVPAAPAPPVPPPPPGFVFLDIETTGLDPERDLILELAILVTDSELNEVAAFETPITYPIFRSDDFRDVVPDKYVLEMHKKSGLLKDVCLKGGNMKDAEVRALRFLNGLHEKRGSGFDGATVGIVTEEPARPLLTLAGFSVHFDRSFLKVHMPALERRFSHRHVDVSVLKELQKRWEPAPSEEKKEPAHRALADCREALEELRRHRARFGGGA